MSSVQQEASAVRAAFSREPGLTAVGVAGLVIAFLSLIAVAVRGSFIPPEGKMMDAVTFTFGVAVFTLTLALLLPLAGFSEPARRRWRRAAYAFLVFGFVLEPLQAFRGVDPRFSDEHTPLETVAGITFGMTAGLMTVLFVFLGVRFFRPDVLEDRPVLLTGIRYGVVAVTISFGVGLMMSVMQGREIGDAGDLMLTHALGVHGIQAIPVVALLLVWAGTAPPSTTGIHVAGIGWLSACAAALIQALLGRPPFALSVLTVLTAAGLVLWAAVAAHAFLAWRRYRAAQVEVVPPAAR